jgi:hypothetical protein
MATKYVNIGSATTTVLLSSSTKQGVGEVGSIQISNNHAADPAVVSLLIRNESTSTDYYFFKTVTIPKGVSLFFDEIPSFDISKYSLKLVHTGSNDLSVIIK